jgi:hypothetical protein
LPEPPLGGIAKLGSEAGQETVSTGGVFTIMGSPPDEKEAVLGSWIVTLTWAFWASK